MPQLLENLEREELLSRLDPAWARGAHVLGEGDPRHLIDLHEHLELRRQQVEGGNTLAILQALAVCAVEEVPAPEWLAEAFTTRLSRFTTYHPDVPGPNSLDTLFHSRHLPAGKPERTQKARKAWQAGSELQLRVREIAHAHSSAKAAVRAVLPVRGVAGVTRAVELLDLVDEVNVRANGWKPWRDLWGT